MFPEPSYYFSPLVMSMASIGIVYTSLSTLRQVDIKRVIAYSSIAHMNTCLLGLFAYNEYALIGSLFLMIGHGVVSSGLFFMIGMLYNRYNTKIIQYINGIIHFMPIFSFFFFLFVLGNIALPGTSNFVGEFLIICGLTYSSYFVVLFNAMTGVFLCTIYSMWLYNKVVFLLPKFNYVVMVDLYLFEILILTPLVLIMFFMGIFPSFFFRIIEADINNLMFRTLI